MSECQSLNPKAFNIEHFEQLKRLPAEVLACSSLWERRFVGSGFMRRFLDIEGSSKKKDHNFWRSHIRVLILNHSLCFSLISRLGLSRFMLFPGVGTSREASQ